MHSHALAAIIASHGEAALLDALVAIAESALDPYESGGDTAAVVYAQLARLGVKVP